mmetsp:Transcript_97654/g.248128  ORF Transcript_97654/g.248128 Transcript_97654/m.248128 type:complete len:210 (+) Transcript_97654:200-829(+)
MPSQSDSARGQFPVLRSTWLTSTITLPSRRGSRSQISKTRSKRPLLPAAMLADRSNAKRFSASERTCASSRSRKHHSHSPAKLHAMLAVSIKFGSLFTSATSRGASSNSCKHKSQRPAILHAALARSYKNIELPGASRTKSKHCSHCPWALHALLASWNMIRHRSGASYNKCMAISHCKLPRPWATRRAKSRDTDCAGAMSSTCKRNSQ